MEPIQSAATSMYSASRLQVLTLPLLGLMCMFGQVPRKQAAFTSGQLLTYCINDASRISWPPEDLKMTSEVPGIDGLVLRASSSARFEVRRYGKTLYSFQIENFSNNGTVVWAPDGKALALIYSDGGAIGNFHVRLFSVSGEVVNDVSKAIEPAVTEFKSRHYCKTRGNNVTALKFMWRCSPSASYDRCLSDRRLRSRSWTHRRVRDQRARWQNPKTSQRSGTQTISRHMS